MRGQARFLARDRRSGGIAASFATSRSSGRLGLSGGIAVLLALAVVGQTLAAAWSTPIPFSTSHRAWANGLVALGGSTAVAAYSEYNPIGKVFVRRSTDGGQTWSQRKRLSSLDVWSGFPDIAGRGTFVDVVWMHYGQDAYRLKYARSTDGGASYQTPVTIASGNAYLPSVARGPNGLVAIGWRKGSSNELYVRVSTDGGVSFGAPTLVGATSVATDGYPEVALAAGNGVVYAAYLTSFSRIRVRRSLDGGVTWSPALRVTNYTAETSRFDITAAGANAYIAYVDNRDQPHIRYQRTLDKGATWSDPFKLTLPSAFDANDPVVNLTGGVLRAAYEACLDEVCSETSVYYRDSSDGLHWSPAEIVSTHVGAYAQPGGVAFAGGALVLYDAGESDPDYAPDVYVRTRAW